MPLPNRLPEDFIQKATKTPALIADRFSIVKKIGSGNFGTAFLIDDNRASNETEKQKVLKQICVGPLDPGETVDAMQEAELLAKMKHKNIVQFHQSFLDGQFFCIVLEYCEGGDLECKIRDCKKKNEVIPEEQVIKWLKQLLRAIGYMHERRVLHRDLKSRNIFLKNNQVKIGDFGISRILIGTCDKASTFVGTPYYMSPEVLKHEQYDAKCDVWSLGCVLYELCCFEHAFEGTSLMDVMVKIVSDYVPHLPDHYSRGLNIILERMLDRDPSRRQTARQILQHPLLARSDTIARDSTQHLTARERLMQRKKEEADVRKLGLMEIAKINSAENARIRRESRERNFLRSALGDNLQVRETSNNDDIEHLETIEDDELHGTVVFQPYDSTLVNAQQGPIAIRNKEDLNEDDVVKLDSTDELIRSLIEEGHIPEDGDLADTLYSFNEDFEPSDDEEELPDELLGLNDTEYRDIVGRWEGALLLDDSVISKPREALSSQLPQGFPSLSGQEESSSVHNQESTSPVAEFQEKQLNGFRESQRKLPLYKNLTVGAVSSRKVYDRPIRPMTAEVPADRPLSMFTSNVVDQRINNVRQRCIDSLGNDLFEKAYEIVKGLRFDDPSQNKIRMEKLTGLVRDRNKCMELEQLIFLEQERNAS